MQHVKINNGPESESNFSLADRTYYIFTISCKDPSPTAIHYDLRARYKHSWWTDMCQDSRKIRDPGSGTSTDPGSWVAFCPGTQWILDLVNTVYTVVYTVAGSCRYLILFWKIATGSWGILDFIRENSIAQVGFSINKYTSLMDSVYFWGSRFFR